MFPSYRNHSIDLQRKSVHWFLQDGKIKTNPVNPCNKTVSIKCNNQNKEVFRILSSIEDRVFWENSELLSTIAYCRKQLHFRSLRGF